MKTKTTALIALFLTFALLFASCGKEEGGASGEDALSDASEELEVSENSAASDEDSAAESSEAEKLCADEIEDYSPYVTLGQYKGVKIAKKEVTDELLRQKREKLLDSVKELREVGKERAAALGDTVVMDYKGFRNDTGEAFEGGEAADSELLLGSGKFIPGFEEALVGRRTGEEFDINLTFPEGYHEKTLAGQPVRFAIKLKAVKETVYPELTDELAKKLNFESAAALLKEAEKLADEQVYAENLRDAWTKAVANAEVKSFPQELFDSTVKDYADYYFNSCVRAAAQYGMDLEAYVGKSEDEFRKELEQDGKEYAEKFLTEEMTMFSIADAEFGRDISESEYSEKVDEYAKREGVTADEFLKRHDEKTLRTNMLWDKVLVFVYENAGYTAESEGSQAS